MTPEIRDELLVLVRAAKAYLAQEQERGNTGICVAAEALQPTTATPARPPGGALTGPASGANAGSAAISRGAAAASPAPGGRGPSPGPELGRAYGSGDLATAVRPASAAEIAAAALSTVRSDVAAARSAAFRAESSAAATARATRDARSAGSPPTFSAPAQFAERGPSAAPAVPAPPTAAPLPAAERQRRLELIAQQASGCSACVLHEKRTQSVFARGSIMAELVFVGEGPGRDEDLQGQPFVGAAGQLLDKMVVAMGYARDDVYICNVVKCRPPENRTPRPEEALACAQYLIPQVEAVAPRMIVALGRCAAQALGVAEATGAWRGRFGVWRGIPVMPTYHPAYLLRSPEFKRTVWEDLQQVMGRLGRARPARS